MARASQGRWNSSASRRVRIKGSACRAAVALIANAVIKDEPITPVLQRAPVCSPLPHTPSRRQLGPLYLETPPSCRYLPQVDATWTGQENGFEAELVEVESTTPPLEPKPSPCPKVLEQVASLLTKLLTSTPTPTTAPPVEQNPQPLGPYFHRLQAVHRDCL